MAWLFLLYCTNEGDAFSLVFIEGISFPIGNTPLIKGRCTKREGSWLFFVAKASKTGLEKAADPKKKDHSE